MAGPIKPNEVESRKSETIPESVIEAFNNLILRHWTGVEAIVRQNEVVELIMNSTGFKRHEIFDNHYLDIEGTYRLAGWVVQYEKPGYNESGEAYFRFSKK